MRLTSNSRLFAPHLLALVLIFCGFSSWAQDSDDELDFLPIEKAFPLTVDRDSNGDVLLYWPVPEGYYLYRKKFSFYAKSGGEKQPLEAAYPAGIFHEDPFFGRSEVYYGELSILLDSAALTPPFVLEVRSQGCADDGLCYPPRRQYFEIGAGPDAIVPTTAEAMSGSTGSAGSGSVETASAIQQTMGSSGSESSGSTSLWLMCLFAVFGGIILNLMPCVFPVLSLKVLSIAGSGASVNKLSHGLAYSVGVVLSFVAVAALLLVLRSGGAAIGWGFHLQAPWFVALLAYLFFAMGLSLSGLLELGAGIMGTGQGLASRDGLSGSFFTGVLATVVASPCTAPFMGSALGFALTQSALVALLVFAFLGIGMALPFMLLSVFPGLMQRLPKPGPWMLTFRQFMAFPMYAAAVWLLWVLGRQTGVNGMAAVAGGAVLVAMCLWLFSKDRSTRLISAGRAFGISVLVAALMILASPLLSPQAAVQAVNAEWEAYSQEREQQLRDSGQPYFVNITADWCLTCLANETYALSDESVREVFREHKLVYLKGDWTNSDPLLTQVLREHGRSGVPLYVLASASGQYRLLPQLLTPGLVLDALNKTLVLASTDGVEVSRN